MLKKPMICLAIFSFLSPNVLAQDAEFEKYLQQREAEFENFSKARLTEFEEFIARWQAAEQAYRAEIAQHWETVEVSSQTKYVEYSDDRQQRTIVDYATNQITIEILQSSFPKQPKQPDEPLEAIDDALETANQYLTRLSNTQVSDAVERDPVRRMAGIKASTVESNATILNADEISFASDALEVQQANGVTTLRLQLSTDLASRRATETLPQVMLEAERWNLSPALILAVMHTESSFNPLARSPIPAFGLMQIVPQSAGRDVTEFLTGEQQLLTPDYLYDPDLNIEAGSVYLHMLYNRYFSGVTDKRSRWFLSIAAYNTGPGNVARTLTGQNNLRAAHERANQMSSKAVYEHLIQHLPANETRLYLQKVTERETFYQQQLGITI